MLESEGVSGQQSVSTNSALPYLTPGAGIGGQLKQFPEDFFVDEIPAYEPSGAGEFLFLQIEKRGLSTPDLLEHIRSVLSLKPSDVTCAGRKDTSAVTRQYVSVPVVVSELIDRIETDQTRVLSAKRHTNRLKTGHHRGNRFRVVVRDAVPNATVLAEEIVAAIRESGFPNYFGDQRFGQTGTTDDAGFRLLRGERVRRMSRDRLRFTLSAVQSRLFNACLADRISDGLCRTVLAGDVMQVTASKGPFVVSDVAVEQARYDCHETVLSGPIYGPKMKQPQGVPGEREQAVLDRFELPREAFSRFRKLTLGTRRPMVVLPNDLSVRNVEHGLEFSFSLPAGVYATSLMRELQKTA